jgi:hypothetical protein
MADIRPPSWSEMTVVGELIGAVQSFAAYAKRSPDVAGRMREVALRQMGDNERALLAALQEEASRVPMAD